MADNLWTIVFYHDLDKTFNVLTVDNVGRFRPRNKTNAKILKSEDLPILLNSTLLTTKKNLSTLIEQSLNSNHSEADLHQFGYTMFY